MKPAFIIEFQYEYRHLGPLIDEFLLNNETVYLFILNNDRAPKHGKWSIPNKDNIPEFVNGIPLYKVCINQNDLVKKIKIINPDMVFLHSGVHPNMDLIFYPRNFLKSLKSTLSNKTKFYSFAGEFYDSVMWGLEALDLFDKIFVINEQAKKIQFDILNTRNYDKSDVKASMDKIQVTGKPCFDKMIENSHITKKNSLVLMTHNFANSKFSRINLSKNKYKNLIKIFIREGKIDFEILKNIFDKTIYSDIIRHIYKFSKKSKIDFVIKTRLKDSQNTEYKEFYKLNSDSYICNADTKFYPKTESSDLISSSKKLIGFKTYSFLEAVITRTKALHLEIPRDNLFKKIDKFNIYNEFVRGQEAGSLNNYKSCINSTKWNNFEEIISFIENNDSIDENDRNEYLKKYIYPPDLFLSSKYIYKSILKN